MYDDHGAKTESNLTGRFITLLFGNQRQKVFGDDRDRLVISTARTVPRAFRFFGLRLRFDGQPHSSPGRDDKSSASKIMQGIQFTYTQTYNRRHRTVGHLSRGDTKRSFAIATNTCSSLVRYIHLNPGHEKSNRPWTYRWSSHRVYMGEKSEVRIETDAVLGQFGKDRGLARRAYVQFMEEGVGAGHEEKYYQATDQRFLGDEAFVETVAARATEKDIEPKGPRASFERLLKRLRTNTSNRERLMGTGRQRD
jgi:hypothetical protein